MGLSLRELEESLVKKTTLISRNITVMGRRTSIRLEPEMWLALRDIANREGCRIHDICSLISLRKRRGTSLTAAIRVFLMLYFRAASNEDGHKRAGHGNFEKMIQRAKIPVHNFHLKNKKEPAFYNAVLNALPLSHSQETAAI